MYKVKITHKDYYDYNAIVLENQEDAVSYIAKYGMTDRVSTLPGLKYPCYVHDPFADAGYGVGTDFSVAIFNKQNEWTEKSDKHYDLAQRPKVYTIPRRDGQ